MCHSTLHHNNQPACISGQRDPLRKFWRVHTIRNLFWPFIWPGHLTLIIGSPLSQTDKRTGRPLASDSKFKHWLSLNVHNMLTVPASALCCDPTHVEENMSAILSLTTPRTNPVRSGAGGLYVNTDRNTYKALLSTTPYRLCYCLAFTSAFWVEDLKISWP